MSFCSMSTSSKAILDPQKYMVEPFFLKNIQACHYYLLCKKEPLIFGSFCFLTGGIIFCRFGFSIRLLHPLIRFTLQPKSPRKIGKILWLAIIINGKF